MPDYSIVLPSKPKVVLEKDLRGVFEIDGLYPGYGHTLGNSLRRIILSSLPGSAITSVAIDGVSHEFSTISGVSEDVITILLNLKRLRLSMSTDEVQEMTLAVKGERTVVAKDITAPGQIEILNLDQHIATLTDKSANLSMTITVERGLGYIPKDVIHKDRVDIGSIALDAIFTPIRRVNYEVENMRVGDRTDFNRLRIFIETDGSLTPREALERSIEIMINQLKAIIGFKEEIEILPQEENVPIPETIPDTLPSREEIDSDVLKTRIESLEGLSARTVKALSNANIRTVGGLARKREDDILSLEGLGSKGLEEIKKALFEVGITLR
jgi:DNA-directed RNA polymerase subunit alpha